MMLLGVVLGVGRRGSNQVGDQNIEAEDRLFGGGVLDVAAATGIGAAGATGVGAAGAATGVGAAAGIGAATGVGVAAGVGATTGSRRAWAPSDCLMSRRHHRTPHS